MRCPFLREAQVKFCQASPYRKLIVRLPDQTARERCSSPDYVNCPSALQHLEERPSLAHCPFLNESLVQYCAAAPVPKYVPFTESTGSRCTTENHRFCELFLAISAPDQIEDHEEPRFPRDLQFTANHFWIDLAEDRTLHIGCDEFLTSTLGPPDRISYVQESGACRPGIVFTVGEVDLPMVFPHPVHLSGTNAVLRTDPGRVSEDPYGRGWLFEGKLPRSRDGGESRLAESLIPGAEAEKWVRGELRRLAELLQELASARHGAAVPSLAGGGIPQGPFGRALTRVELLRLHAEFFSPFVSKPPSF
jgi:glycine cleavage system H lipoate-binding protein